VKVMRRAVRAKTIVRAQRAIKCGRRSLKLMVRPHMSLENNHTRVFFSVGRFFAQGIGMRSALIAGISIAALASISGCASPSSNAMPKYEPPSERAPAATIDVGTHGHAWSIDGAETPSFAKTVRLVPGEHRVGLNCLEYEVVAVGVLPTAVGALIAYGAQFVLVTGSFDPGRTYYMRCVAVNGRPRAWLADSPGGSDMPPGFTAICTRGCPPQ
jgi:hypothetical protein